MKGIVIDVTNGYKKYGSSNYILKGVNLSVPEGSIYSLLGPSGCGKTTLFSCMVGLQKLTSGFISMPTIKSPLDFGYMPQDIALEEACTIDETFYLYALLLSIPEDDMIKRLDHLTALLQLPNGKTLIKHLSGGQQRRISFAVALLHNANILLLDEPTVGLDPLLTQSIWSYLTQTVERENKTIVITTHYIEEARNSNKVGFMRGGKILQEGNPDELMNAFACNSLEDVFIQLCYNDDEQCLNSTSVEHIKPKKTYLTTTSLIEDKTFNTDRFKALMYKDYLWTKRNLVLFMLMMMMPVMQSLLFGWIYGHYPDNLKVGIVTYESKVNQSICSPRPASDMISFDDYGSLQCNLTTSLSCHYYRKLREKFNVVLFDDIGQARSSALDLRVWALVHIKKNFTEAFVSRINEALDPSDETLLKSTVDVNVDMSDYIYGSYVKYKLTTMFDDTLKLVSVMCNINEDVINLPFKVVEELYKDTISNQFVNEVGSFISGYTLYFSMLFTSTSLIAENTNGVFSRNKAMGVTFVEMILSHTVIQLLIATVQNILMLLLLFIPFKYVLHGNVFIVAIGMYLLDFVGIATGILLSVLFSGTLPVMFIILTITLGNFFLGGFLWPEEGMHKLLYNSRLGFPAQQIPQALGDIIKKGVGITYPTVYQGYISAVLWVILIGLITYLIKKIKT